MLILFAFFRELGHFERSNSARYYHPPPRRRVVQPREISVLGVSQETDLTRSLELLLILVTCILIVVVVVVIVVRPSEDLSST